MKTNKVFSIVIMLCCFVSCQMNNNNVILSAFTMDFISLYLNNDENQNIDKRKNEIILIGTVDTSSYYLTIFANNPKEYVFCREDYLGQTMYSGVLVRVYGDKNNML